jgi:AcrR family transcriptional regulator
VSSSQRRDELVEAAYEYVLQQGLADLSLRPIAQAIGSSTGVLRFLFGSKDGLVRAVLQRARQDELRVLDAAADTGGLADAALRAWEWLRRPEHRPALILWTESYVAALRDPEGPWADFAQATVTDWLAILAATQPRSVRDTAGGRAQRTAVLALLRGAFLDLIATGDSRRVDRAVREYLQTLKGPQTSSRSSRRSAAPNSSCERT